jgi:3-oxoacyl-[acyl-carrier-protein] synthase II
MKKLVITGTGMVSPVGMGSHDVWNAVGSGAGGMRKLPRFPSLPDILCGEIGDFDLGDYIRDTRFRRAAPVSRYALASTALALAEAGPACNNDDTGLFMGITHGALNYTQAFHRELLESGPGAVSPVYFSDSVLNAPAGNASICFGLRGPVHTVLGGAEAAVKSIMMACRMLDDGEIERAIVVAAEELNEFSLAYHTRLGVAFISEGAGSVVIEKEEAASQSSPYCYIAGMDSGFNPSGPSAALRDSLERCMDSAGLKLTDMDLALAGVKNPVGPLLEGTPTASLTPLMGDAFAVSMMWDTIFSAMAIKKGSIPQSVVNCGEIPSRLNNVLVCAADGAGGAASIILSRHV